MYCKNLMQAAKLRQFIATICLGPITFGATLSWTSPVLPQLQNHNSTLPFTLTVEEGSWVGSMLAIGVFCTAIPSGYLADRFGIKRCMVALAVPNVIFSVIVFFSKDVYSLCIARFISAVCGSYVNYITLTIILGVCSLVLAIALLFHPESPSYLVRIGKQDDAIIAIKYYRNDDYDVTQEIKTICDNLQEQNRQDTVNIQKALMSKPVVRGLVACVGLTMFQQLSAVDAIVFYTVYIFQESETGMDAYTSAIILSVVQLLSAVLVVFVIEKAGRRTFLYLSAFWCGVSLAVLGIYFNLKSNNINFAGMDYIPLTSLIVFSIGFALGLGPVLWLVNGELFSHDVKGVANGITISTNWIFLFIVTKTFPIA
ncbi:hypothetical protein FQR65_LT05953 [Abscondita terminalis]|nr:hypothetical protein FQR65_LT05953 [Abscondita terminalis]